MTKVEVTQEDREAAEGLGCITDERQSIVEKAFARHRQAAYEKGLKDAALVAPENVRRSVMASAKLGKWLAAALEDSNVCDDMKADIREWFSAGDAVQFIGQYHAAQDSGVNGVEYCSAKIDRLLFPAQVENTCG